MFAYTKTHKELLSFWSRMRINRKRCFVDLNSISTPLSTSYAFLFYFSVVIRTV